MQQESPAFSGTESYGGSSCFLMNGSKVKTLVGYKDWMDSMAELVGCEAPTVQWWECGRVVEDSGGWWRVDYVVVKKHKHSGR